MPECRSGEHTADCHGRHTCTQKYRCPECAWVGPLRDARHEYRPASDGDVEPWDYCKDCGSDRLEPAT